MWDVGLDLLSALWELCGWDCPYPDDLPVCHKNDKAHLIWIQ
jgi:hypothetical protein